jgi:hypothetical protein
LTWAYFDDGAPKHPKAVSAGNEAWSLWAAAIMYCNRWLTDGVVSLNALASDCLPVPISKAKAKKLADELCDARVKPDEAGLFERNEDGSYTVHDFLEWNKSKAEVQAKRATDRARKKTGGTPPSPPPGTPPPSGPRNGIQPESDSDSTRKSNGIPSGSGADSASLAHVRARRPAPAAQPSPAQPSPPQPVDLPASKPDPSLVGRSAPPASEAGGLANRVKDLGTEPDGTPKPRLDDLREKLAFVRWWPSLALLTWARERGLSDEQFDEALGDVRAKTTHAGDIGWWDRRIIAFLKSAIARFGRPVGTETAEQRAAAEASVAEQRRREVAAFNASRGVVPLASVDPAEVQARMNRLAEGA